MRSQNPGAQFRWLGAAVLLNAAMLFGRFGMGTYGPLALTLVGISLLACVWALSAPVSSAGLPSDKPGRRQMQLGLAAIVLLHIGLGIATLRWVPAQRVDVYLFQQDA